MKRPLIYALFTLLSFTKAFAQEKIWTKQTKISKVIAFEKKVNPKSKFLNQEVFVSKEYYPLAEKYVVANPIIVQRVAQYDLPIYAEYYFTPGDSILRLISYNWEKGRYGDLADLQKTWKEENTKFDVYGKEYERIKKMLISQFGKATTADASAKTVNSEESSYLERNTLWETENMHLELNMIFAQHTHRIRMTLYWKN
ncbi:hypothetical protein [Pedobacter foliorum]|uniref:hypothetical protein n=1 Tax=Pedobacter foliorum TaxID=2739058 RepID=UPI001566C9A5|nr:hypothetical protein [Pedobacter foliorum]NRF37561.1 hypothetical protein [Pedobacter foliorum]